MTVWDILFDAGYFPITPLWTHFQHELIRPRHYEDWMAYDDAMMLQCDAGLRLPGPSSGANRECKGMAEAGLPLVNSVHHLFQYIPADREEFITHRRATITNLTAQYGSFEQFIRNCDAKHGSTGVI